MKVKIVLFALLPVVFLQEISVINNLRCKQNDYLSYTHMGSFTIYENVRGFQNLTNKVCRPQQIWTVIRHGIRYSTYHYVKPMENLLEKLKKKILVAHDADKGEMCLEDVNSLSKWRFDKTIRYEDTFLTVSGAEQMKNLGMRLKTYFPEFLNGPYDEEKFFFGYSDNQRAVKSLHFFLKGFFENDLRYNPAYVGELDKVCEYDCNLANLGQFSDNYEGVKMSAEFARVSRIFEKISLSLSNRTGLSQQLFNRTIIKTMFEACVAETGKDLRISPWCLVFDLPDLELMTYREETFQYGTMAYGSRYKDKIGCVQMKSLLSTFNDTVENRTAGKVLKAYFGHEGTLTNIFVPMGCFKDEHEKYVDKYYRNFTWNNSELTPTSGNIIAVLYSCGNSTSDYEIQFFLNEKPMGCCFTNSTDACKWSTFRDRMSNFVLNCKEDFCNTKSTKSIAIYFKISKLVIFLTVILSTIVNNQ